MTITWNLSLLLIALLMGTSFGHVLELGPKLAADGRAFEVGANLITAALAWWLREDSCETRPNTRALAPCALPFVHQLRVVGTFTAQL